MTVIYLVRHCESMANRIFSFAGRTDVDISAKGELQLECVSEYFKTVHLDTIYSSPLLRAKKTAEAIAKYNSLPIITDERLIEINLGVMDGRPVSEMTDRQNYMWYNEPHNFHIDGGETMQQVADRAFEAIKEIAEYEDGKVVAVATHGCVIRNLMRIFHKFAPVGIKEVDWCDNCGINRIIYAGGEFSIDLENYTEHLSEDAAAVPISEWVK